MPDGAAAPTQPRHQAFTEYGAIELTPIDQLGPGTPLRQSGGMTTQSLGDVAAIAARGNELFVIDRQQGALLRIDLGTRDVQMLLPLRLPDTRGLHVTEDGIVHVVDRFERAVRQVDSYGYSRQVFSEVQYLASPVDVAVLNNSGQVIVADELENHLVVFNPLGAVTSIIGDRFRDTVMTQSISAIAPTSRGILIADASMAEAVEIDLDGRLLASYGEVDLSRPIAVTADDCGRIYVIDKAGLFTSGLPADTEPARHTLPAGFDSAATDLWIENNVLYVAAGVYGVQMFAVNPPCVGA